jgi:hypothetical protein
MKSLSISLLFLITNLIVAQENNTIKYGKLLEFKVPEKYELRTNAFLNEVNGKVLAKLKYEKSASQYILQPRGMNDMDKQTELYSRIIIDIEYGDYDNNEKVGKYNNEKIKSFENKVEEFLNGMVTKMPSLQINNVSPVSIIRFKNKNFIVYDYKRELNHNPEVLVKTLTFQEETFLIRFTISYRVSEKEYWAKSISDFLNNVSIKT